MNFGVVIVTYNRLNLLKECIENVLNQETKFSKIIIVDNCSTDGTKEYLKMFEKKAEFVIVNLEKNLGGSYGFFEGLRRTLNLNLDWTLLIDDDAMIDKTYIAEIKTYILEDKGKYRAYSGTVITDGNIVCEHRKRINNVNFYSTNIIKEREYNQKYFLCDIASFCGLVIENNIVKEIGLPEKDYFIWNDDTEYCLRINKFSKIKNINGAVLNHKTSLGGNGLSWKKYYGVRNSIHMINKHFGEEKTKKTIKKIYWQMIRKCIRFMLQFKFDTVGYIYNLYKKAIADGLNGRLGVNSEIMPK